MTGKMQASRFNPKRNIVPDRLDLRDRPYLPSIAVAPPATMKPRLKLPVLDQADTNACTGFALSNVVNFLSRLHQDPKAPHISPFMLYSMARRYDEFPGASEDSGSSLRGAMKGWYKHGACRFDLWKTLSMPPPAKRAKDDWWLDAAQRPLGAYYRVDPRSVPDMHVALNEVGILYASCVCHDGWLKRRETKVPQGKYWVIPQEKPGPDGGGHAFVIVGYTQDGFLLQNSWRKDWGTGGLAILTYEDWLENAMDCWVAQLGVVTEQHREVSAATTLRVVDGMVRVAADPVLRDRELSPFIVDMENNGRLSSTGLFRTQPGDVEALVNAQVAQARKKWQLGPQDPTDVAVYAHGGLTGEGTAAETAAKWIPALYDAQVFPIFFMWETDLLSTLKDRLEDLVSGLPKPTAGLMDQLTRFWNQRLDRLLAPAGSVIWGEMKQNADAITAGKDSGGQILYRYGKASPWFEKGRVRLHLIGHSAGAIVHCHLVQRLADLGWRFESVNFMAPAVTVALFEDTLLPRIKDGSVRRFHQLHLTDTAELRDETCRPVLGYGRSLLYLVSESFEGGVRTPILGMEKYFAQSVGSLNLKSVHAWAAPGPASASTTHGGFDDDATTMQSIISLMKTGALPA
ncbi:MAG TPA: C1 family peptidase [Candidatus Acidoferrum sp.]|nr:C1 family peptidase [Candidatus Acidoferrum sp.]